MKPYAALLLALSLSSLPAQEKAAKPAPTSPAVAPGIPAAASVTEERTATVVFPDPALDKLEGKVVRIDAEKQQLLLRTKNGKEPIPYNVNPATKFVDLDGRPVDPALIIAEVPVEVRYVENGPELLASTVIVQRYQAPLPGGGVTLTNRETLKAGGKVVGGHIKTTTTTSGPGTIGSIEKGILTVVSEGVASPLRYRYSESTEWVNANGEPLPVAGIRPGYSVKVIYSHNGEAVIAERIVVFPPARTGSPPSPPPAAPPAPAVPKAAKP